MHIHCRYVLWLIDVNECEQDPDPCAVDVRRVCVNTNGSYTCNCTLGHLENANSVCEGELTD